MKTFKDLKVGDIIFCLDCYYSDYFCKYKILKIEDSQINDSIIKITLQGHHSKFCIYMGADKSIGTDMFSTYYTDVESVLQGVIVQW